MVICKKIFYFWTLFWDFWWFLVWQLWLFVKLRRPVTCDRRIDLIGTVGSSRTLQGPNPSNFFFFKLGISPKKFRWPESSSQSQLIPTIFGNFGPKPKMVTVAILWVPSGRFWAVYTILNLTESDISKPYNVHLRELSADFKRKAAWRLITWTLERYLPFIHFPIHLHGRLLTKILFPVIRAFGSV